MGYTHYWELDKHEMPTIIEWMSAMDEIDSLISSAGYLAFESDRPNEEPLLDLFKVRFNGIGDEGHETFYIARKGQGFHFCKTAHKPYDKYVVEVLKILKRRFPKWIILSSDGGEEVFATDSV